MPLIINLMLLKMIHKSKFVQIFKAKSIEIKRTRNKVINIDGEPIKLERDLQIDVNPLSLNIIIP
jgi:diacylglycerol kinase family enzyme